MRFSTPPVTLYDTSGPYTDPSVAIDIRQGLSPIRNEWIRDRDDVEDLLQVSSRYGKLRLADHRLDALRFKHLRRPVRAKAGRNVSQMHYAPPRSDHTRDGIHSHSGEPAAGKANWTTSIPATPWGASLPARITPEFVRDEVARGRAVIPANVNHPELEPVIIGRNFLVKINANIGNSAVSSTIEEEVEKMVWAIRWGSDTVMDLSTGPNIHETREMDSSQQPGSHRHRAPSTRHWKRSRARPRNSPGEIFRDTLVEQGRTGGSTTSPFMPAYACATFR